MSSQAPKKKSSPADPYLIEKLEQARPVLMKRLLQMHFEAGVGHVGGNLSCLDILSTCAQMINWNEDHLILSKGHSAGALYIALWSAGRIQEEELKLFHQNNSPVGGHPSPHFKNEIPFFTGSLGHGLSLACGLALGKKLQRKPGHVFVLLSDGEWQEGSCWEALNFIRHHKLNNMTLMTDFNGLQGFGGIDDVASMGDLPARVQSFGIPTKLCAGHDFAELVDDLQTRESRTARALFFRTHKGHGISFMEDRLDSHYWTLTAEKYQTALEEIDRKLP